MRLVYYYRVEHSAVISPAHCLDRSDRYASDLVLLRLYLSRHISEHAVVLVPCLFDEFVPVCEYQRVSVPSVCDGIEHDRLSAPCREHQQDFSPFLPALLDRANSIKLVRSEVKSRCHRLSARRSACPCSSMPRRWLLPPEPLTVRRK